MPTGPVTASRGPNPRSNLLPIAFGVALTLTPEFDFHGIPKVRITDLMLPLLWMGLLSGNKSSKNEPIPLFTPILLIILWDLGALLAFGVAPLTPGIFYLGKRAAYFLIYAYGVSVAREGVDWKPIVKAIVFSSPLLGLTVLLEQGQHAGEAAYRASGIIRDQEASTAYFLVLVIGLIVGTWSTVVRPVEKAALLVALVASVKTLFATGTRGGLILFAVVSGILLLRNPRASMPMALLLVSVGYLSWLFTPQGVQDRLRQVSEESHTIWSGVTGGADTVEGLTGSSSTADRMVAADRAFRFYVAQAPATGLGTAYKKLGFVDDMYISEWVYHGLIGLLLWMTFQLGIGRLFWVAQKQLPTAHERALATAMFAVWVAYCLGGFTADMFYLIRPTEGFCLIGGLVVGLLTRREVPPTPKPGSRPRFQLYQDPAATTIPCPPSPGR